MLEYITMVITGVLNGCFMLYVLYKTRDVDGLILQKIDLVLTEIRENPELQQKVYSLGLLLGAGIKQGVGLGGGGGKRNLENTIIQGIASMFFGGKKEEEQPFKLG